MQQEARHNYINRPVLFFDGDCALCNRAVRYVIQLEGRPAIVFASLQSEVAAKLLSDFFADMRQQPDSILLLYEGTIYIKTAALLQIAVLSGGWLRLLKLIYLIPNNLRDKLYDFIASRRRKWFGKSLHCGLMHGIYRDRFIDL